MKRSLQNYSGVIFFMQSGTIQFIQLKNRGFD